MDIVIVAGIAIALVTSIPVILQLRQHPRGLTVLFFAEMWERFSYYGMRGLLIFYLTQHFLFDDKTAAGQYGAYTSLVYLLPVIGGFLADRYLGARKAVAFGALLLVAGHMTMAIEGQPSTQQLAWHGATYDFRVTGRADARDVKLLVAGQPYAYAPSPDGGLDIKALPAAAPLPAHLAKGDYEITVKKQDPLFRNILYVALSLIIMGVGFLKANISAIVGQLYPQGDPRRDPGFTLYYYGINLGSFLASILCGWLGQTVGWWAGFGAAGVGMALGWLVFVLGKPMLEGKGEPPNPVELAKPRVGPLSQEWLIYLGGIAGVGVIWVVVQSYAVVNGLLVAGAVAVLGYLAWYMVTKADKTERERILLAVALILASVVFWALYEQGGSSLNLFASRNINLHLYGDQAMKPAQAQSFQSGWILILAPVMAAIWTFLGRFGRDPNPVAKFGFGLLMIGASYYVLILGGTFAGPDFKAPLIFLAAAYLMQTTGEMCVSPVGLSQMTKLAPPALISTLMATWFLGTAGAQGVAGWIARLTAADTIGGEVLDPGKALATYSHVFGVIGLWGLGAGVVMLVVSPWLKKLAHDRAPALPAQEPAVAPAE
jgi:POT family proton-dependent oligopeptide transporter